MSEVDEMNIISFNVSIPVDVLVHKADASVTVSEIVKDSIVTDCVDRDIPNPS